MPRASIATPGASVDNSAPRRTLLRATPGVSMEDQMHDHSPLGVHPSGCPSVAQLATARNFLRSNYERWTDARMLALNRWPNIDCYQRLRGCSPRLAREKIQNDSLDRPNWPSARNFLRSAQIAIPDPARSRACPARTLYHLGTPHLLAA